MTHAVIGIFDDYSDAKEAVDSLKKKGIENDQIDLAKRQSAKKSEAEKQHEERTGENGLTRFFRKVFGNDDDNAEKYSRVAYDIGTVVTVYSNTEEEAQQVADILDDCGAIDVDERASHYGGNWKMVDAANNVNTPAEGAAPQQTRDTSTPMVTQERTRTGERTSPGTGVEITGGSRSKSRIIPWKGEASATLREDRLTETKFW